MISNSENKLVRFDKYCPNCEYWNDGVEIQYCDDCLEESVREGTEKPVRYEEKSNG